MRQVAADFPDLIADVRGVGLMLGLVATDPDISQLLIANLVAQEVLVAYTLNQTGVIRLEPPLITPADVLDDVLERIRKALGLNYLRSWERLRG